MPSYSIDFAKSGRAACKNKKCGEKIEKGELRIGATSEGPQGYDVCKWYHVRCFPMPRKLSDKMTVEKFVEDILEDASQDNSILPDKKDEICELLAAKPVTPKGESGDPYLDQLKACMDNMTEADEAEEEGDENDSKMKKKGKRKKSTSNDEKEPDKKRPKKSVDPRAVEVYAKIHKMKLPELQDILRWNRQVLKGTKPVVMRKIIDGELNGRLGFCQVCGGKLKMNDTFDKVLCGGKWDEDQQIRQQCSVTCDVDKAPRLPWVTQKPTEEEEEEMNRIEAEARGEENEGDEAPDKDSDLGRLIMSAKDIELDFSNKQNTQATTAKVVQLLKENGKLDLPDDEGKLRMDVGQLLVSNKDASINAIMTKLAKLFGWMEKKAAKAMKQEKAAGSSCAVPANAPLLMAMKELSDLYYKEGNSNAGNTYKKIVAALKDLSFEVTAKNAKSLGSGKNKVPGIGAGSAKLMLEFLTTGTMQKLEEKRQNHA